MAHSDTMKILIVDPDKFLVGMYSLKFQSKGFSVDSSLSAPEALRKIRQGARPDVILLDSAMGGRDGMEFLKTIRGENLVPHSKIVILTNEHQSSSIEEAKTLKADGYIVKSSLTPGEVLDEVMNIRAKK